MDTSFDWQFPYVSPRMPVLARNAVATSQPLAAQAGLRMLLQGGNAVDAAIAAAVTLTVVEPVSNGIGSDAFALVWDGDNQGGKLHGLNASGRAPAAWSPQRYAGLAAMPLTGWDAVTVPGAVSAWVALSEKFGRLPFVDLFEPAIAYARDGYAVSPTIARQWRNQTDTFSAVAGFAEAFLPGGRAPRAGEKFAFPDQARTLASIAKTKGAAFYRGELAEKMVSHCRAHGGAMTLDDLAGHRADWVEPISQSYRGTTLHELPPNGQGIAALIALGILEHCDLPSCAVDSADSLHSQIEAMKLAFADVYRHVADPAAMQLDCGALLDPDYLKQRARLIKPGEAQDFGHGTPPSGGTVYLTAADAEGMMVSLIQSNYMGFGSGVVVPGTGISLQNRGAGFNLQAGHPNCVAGGKRPFHTILPAFVSRAGEPLMSFGVMGANMQPQGHVQVMVRLAAYRQNPQAACDAPRFRVVGNMQLALEAGLHQSVYRELARRGHQLVEVGQDYNQFGAAQLIYKLDDGYFAASDPRRDGQAVGF